MQARKCCLHCPGTWASSQKREEHDCNLPTYIKGNLKLSSMKKYILGEAERSNRLRGTPVKMPPSRRNSCYDRFAIAKKFHSENLQHQPLPDKIDDNVFRNVKSTPQRFNETSLNRVKSSGDLIPTRRLPIKNCHKLHADIQYAPALGCKTPATNMDLAICWETPPDPCYEPPWPAHIDGSNDYPAPAIFTRVQHENEQGMTYKSPMERFEAKFCNVKNRCDCNQVNTQNQSHNCHQTDNDNDDNEEGLPISDDVLSEHKSTESKKSRSSIDLCQNLDAIHISEDHRLIKSGYLSNPAKRQPAVHLRNCSPSECRGDRTKRFRSRSIHSAPVNTEKKNNGLPLKAIVPRPRTPYAKRDYCIDTLTPPFNIIEGCRDADYPEHWRLTSVYQQSYRNPRKRIGPIIN
ncbi:hypothetical protein PV325_001765 [Microctonus aethiopoides]|nr:hypothetical protein PV325_001765 [Microctonus aethiopoides]